MNNHLPTEKTTWHPIPIIGFDGWIKEQKDLSGHENTLKSIYIDNQIRALKESTSIEDETLEANRLRELSYASLHYRLTGDVVLIN